MGMAKTASRLALLAALSSLQPATAFADLLEDGFDSPPQEARPRVWWHWMNGNVSEDGIRRDLAWMADMGLGGVQIIDVALGAPPIVPKPVIYGSAEWRRAMALAIAEGTRRGLEMGIGAGPGWSGTGGPWVRPADGMKKLVWSSAVVVGGRPVSGQVAPPPRITGTYQAVPAQALSAVDDHAPAAPEFYADVAVLAYPVPDGTEGPVTPDRVEIAGKAVQLGQGPLPVEAANGSEPAVTLHLTKPRTIRSLHIGFAPAGMFTPFSYSPRLEASRDGGGTWERVADIPYRNGVPTTISFAPVTASDLRIVLGRDARPRGPGRETAPGVEAFAPFSGRMAPPQLVELALFAEPQIHLAEIKAGFAVTPDYDALLPVADAAKGVAPGSVIDITGKLAPDGSIAWTPPPGRWKIVRFGYSLIGTLNHPVSREAAGLEVDKMDAAATRRYMDAYLAFQAQAAPLGPGGIRTLVYDSTEAGAANWTADMLGQFARLRGYDARPWLPALTGQIVGDRAASEKFLSDFRQTIADLVADAHYRTVAEAAREHGMITYAEALEGGRPSLGNDLAMRSAADVPMGALWTWIGKSGPGVASISDLRGAASIAHFNGRKLVSAESMTSVGAPWGWSPAKLKKVIDLEFALGVNQPIIHSSVHVAAEDKLPGISLMDVGIYFNRNETWAAMARPWIDYLARTAFLLQQGRPVADLAYFMGEEAPLTGQFEAVLDRKAPVDNAFDYIDARALRSLSIDKGDLVSPNGARYRALYLGEASRSMTLATLQHIADLARSGATIIGRKPERSPSLADDPAAFSTLAAALWSGPHGAEKVLSVENAQEGLRLAGVAPDLLVEGAASFDEIAWNHRRTDDADIYYVVNRTDADKAVTLSLRVAGRAVQIWNAEDGSRADTAYRIQDGRTLVPLELAPHDAVFVVLRGRGAGRAAVAATPVRAARAINGPWTVSFQNARGAPDRISMPRLQSLSEVADPGVRYYSGTITYETTFKLAQVSGERAWLDLGAVAELAQVRVNGALVGSPWRAPFRVPVGKALRKGENHISVTVANLWVNRLIGDKQPGARKITFTTIPTYRADAPLPPSGLIGPVTLQIGE